ncbi:MAG: MarR family transcriptional regulator [Spirochaetales bacterium]|nr:MarR family transcriptional regulator [Spirochaetales bacterium]
MDNLTFYSLLSLLQGGMWLLNDIENFLKDFGISHGRFSVLLSLKETKDHMALPADIARSLGKSKPTITKMIGRMESDGLVVINTGKRDGRTREMALTEKGIKLLDRIVPEYNKRLSLMSRNVSDKDKRVLMNIVAKIDFMDESKKIRFPE